MGEFSHTLTNRRQILSLVFLPGASCQQIPIQFMQPVLDKKDYASFLPPLAVDGTGTATSSIIAPKMSLKQFNKQVLLIYGDPLQYPDQEFPYVAGSAIACGVVPLQANTSK